MSKSHKQRTRQSPPPPRPQPPPPPAEPEGPQSPPPPSPPGAPAFSTASSEPELAALEREIEAAVPPPAAEPGRPDVEAVVDTLGKVAELNNDALAQLGADDCADLLEMGFGLVADQRGKHWEMTKPESTRIGAWMAKAVQRHGWEWLNKWLPDIMAALLIGLAVTKRVELDRKLKAAEPAPA